MARFMGIDHQGVELQRKVSPTDLDSVVLRSIGRQELRVMIDGNWALWGPDEHFTYGGFRGDNKPDDNSDSEMILAGNHDNLLPPDGSVGKKPAPEDLDRMMGGTLIENLLAA